MAKPVYMAPEQWEEKPAECAVRPENKRDPWVLPVEGATEDRKPIPSLRSEFDALFGQLSPDSHWMAYTSDQSGWREVYVRPFPPGDGDWTISIAGGTGGTVERRRQRVVF